MLRSPGELACALTGASATNAARIATSAIAAKCRGEAAARQTHSLVQTEQSIAAPGIGRRTALRARIGCYVDESPGFGAPRGVLRRQRRRKSYGCSVPDPQRHWSDALHFLNQDLWTGSRIRPGDYYMATQAMDCLSTKRMDFLTRNHRTLRVLLVSLFATAMLALAAGPATAQVTDPTDAQYEENGVAGATAGGGGGGEEGGVAGATAGGTGTSAGGLPFTGLDLALASVVGALLVGTGLVMRRAST